MTGFAERNSKWDVEYEGKDAKGTLVRPFEPGWGDSRALPEKMLGETNIMAVMRSMGRNMPHSGAGDGQKVFNTEDDPESLKRLIKEEAEKDGVGRHFSANKPKSPAQIRSEKHLARLNKEFPTSPVMKNGTFDSASAYSRHSNGQHTAKQHALSPPKDNWFIEDNIPRTRDKPLRNEGAHAMLDRKGPNVLSGPIPRDGFTTNAYEDLTRDTLHKLGYSDVLGETGERPDEIANGIDHLDKLETLGKSDKDLAFTDGFTGNTKLYEAKLNVGGHVDAARRGESRQIQEDHLRKSGFGNMG